MDFTFTPEQRLMASTFRKLADDLRAPAEFRAGAYGDTATEAAGDRAVAAGERGDRHAAGAASRSAAAGETWRRLADLGLPGMLAPESAGGLGLTDTDFVLIAEEAGRAALAQPLIEHAGIAVPLLRDLAGQTLTHVASRALAGAEGRAFADAQGRALAGGEGRALADAEGRALAGAEGRALAGGEGRALANAEGRGLAGVEGRALLADILARAASGTARIAIGHPINPYVLGGAEADYLLVVSSDEVHLVEPHHARLTPVESIDKGRWLVKVEVPAEHGKRVAAGVVASEAYRCAFERGALYSAAQLVGLCQRMIDLAVAYARERRQFGKPIGSCQAIQHALADVQVKLEFARPVLYFAATCVCAPGLRAQAAVSHAKVAATDAADLAARTAMQVHGAMGYSWEVDLHVYMKRAWALAGAWGDRSYHVRRVSSLVLDGRIELGPEHTFD